ncbi:MAG: molybdenum cofactor biosysynthesis protein [Candidatus Hydrogenedentes bacterium]|nr:molybdenum cofactor biosysynthesis protein [Candidatus Hydrogenedentota bacterium]
MTLTHVCGAPRIRHIYISPGHNFRGHHGREPSVHPVLELDEVECVAGKGLVGDRYFGYKEDYKGQVTFFDWLVYLELCRRLGVTDTPPSALRRNIILEGLDLSALIGREFAIQDVKFFGMEECSPCYWMDRAIGPGAEEALRSRGGLRAKVLTNGRLRRN